MAQPLLIDRPSLPAADSPPLPRAFYRFVAERPDATWMHWNMCDAFGFDALAQRLRTHHGRPVDIRPERLFDLACHLKRRFGYDDIGHPRLQRLIDKNGLRG